MERKGRRVGKAANVKKLRNLFDDFSLSDEENSPTIDCPTAGSQHALDKILSKARHKRASAKNTTGDSGNGKSCSVTSLSASSEQSHHSSSTQSSTASQQLDSLLRSAHSRAQRTKRNKKKPVIIFDNDEMFSSSDSSPVDVKRIAVTKRVSAAISEQASGSKSLTRVFASDTDSDGAIPKAASSRKPKQPAESVDLVANSFEEENDLDCKDTLQLVDGKRESLANDVDADDNIKNQHNFSMQASFSDTSTDGAPSSSEPAVQLKQEDSSHVKGSTRLSSGDEIVEKSVSLQVSFNSSQSSPEPPVKSQQQAGSPQSSVLRENKSLQASFSSSSSDVTSAVKPRATDSRQVSSARRQVRASLSDSDFELPDIISPVVRPKVRRGRAAKPAPPEEK